MDATEIQRIIAAAREDESIELKRALPRGRRHLRTLGAFANGVGGTLVVGVADDGTVIGVADPEGVRRTLVDELARHVRPHPPSHVAIVPAPPPATATARLVVIRIRRGDAGPYAVRLPGGRWQCYVRERDRTLPLPTRAADQVANPERSGLPKDAKAAEALRLLAHTRSLTRAALAQTLNLSARRADRVLTALLRAGLAFAETAPRETRYALTPQGRRAADKR